MKPQSITIGANGEYRFSAAHAGLHGGELEPLHGHTYQVTLTLVAGVDEGGMVVDFGDIAELLSGLIAPLKRRTLMPRQLPGGRVAVEGGQVLVECGNKRYSLPEQDVVLLPVLNTSTEALARWLLDELTTDRCWPDRFQLAELTVAESPAASASARADPAAWARPDGPGEQP